MELYSDLPTFLHPTRKGWLCHDGPSGGLQCWEAGHGPWINRNHTDGPLLVFSDGQGDRPDGRGPTASQPPAAVAAIGCEAVG